MANTQSTVTIQDLVNDAKSYGVLTPILDIGGAQLAPALTIANIVMNEIAGPNFPQKWNISATPVFNTNSFQQDYALVTGNGGASVTDLAYLEDAIAIDINNSALPKPTRTVEVGRQLPPATGNWWANTNTNVSWPSLVNAMQNYALYYGTWGQASIGNTTWGNNPVSGSVYVNPLVANGSMPSNPIMQIKDSNGNYLVLTTYGTEGTAAPLASSGATPGTTVSGTGASTVWTVVDPNGWGIRVLPVPSQSGTVWQINVNYQKKPKRFTSLGQTLDPLPDNYSDLFRQGFIAQCFRRSPLKQVNEKFATEWALFLRDLKRLTEQQDREQEEFGFVPTQSILGRGSNYYGGFQGPNPYWP